MAIPYLQRACQKCYKRNLVGIDREFWDKTRRLSRSLYDQDPQTCIGIKGLPGKLGIGHGHYPFDRKKHGWHYRDDPKGVILKRWVGPESARVYFNIAKEVSYA